MSLKSFWSISRAAGNSLTFIATTDPNQGVSFLFLRNPHTVARLLLVGVVGPGSRTALHLIDSSYGISFWEYGVFRLRVRFMQMGKY